MLELSNAINKYVGSISLKSRPETLEGSGNIQLTEEHMFKVVIDGDDGGVDMLQVFERLNNAINMRTKYKKATMISSSTLLSRLPPSPQVQSLNGIYSITDHQPSNFCSMIPWSVFASDADQVRLTIGNSVCARACAHRLKIIQERSKTFFLLNSDIEEKPNYRKAGGVFSSVARVDNSVKLSKSLCAQELLEMIIDKYHRFPDEIVGRNANQPHESLTLRELFDSYGISDPSVLTVEALGWHHAPRARTRVAENPLNSLSSILLRTFLNFEGTFAPKTIKRIASANDISHSANYATEYRIPLYCSNMDELVDIANFLKRNEIGPYRYNMWVLQLCFYDSLPEGTVQTCKTVQDQLDSIFLPLINATLNIDDSRYGSVGWLLPQIGALQIESGNSDPTPDFDKMLPPPSQMPCDQQRPSQLYYAYYIHANLNVLNSLRSRKGMNTFQLRISAATLNLDAIIAGYLFADVLTQVRLLHTLPVAQYLLGMHHVGLTVAPIYDNSQLGTPYRRHQLPTLLHLCLNVSLSTEKPLEFHHDFIPLREEYSTAQKLFHLSALDMTELARNSIMMSSFGHAVKITWLGDAYSKGVIGNNFLLSEVTNIRLNFREESWANEREMIDSMLKTQQTMTTSVNTFAPRRRSVHSLSTIQTGLWRWNFLSSLVDVEYFAVFDKRIRFPRTVISGPRKDNVTEQNASKLIAKALSMRRKYVWKRPNPWEVKKETNLEADFQQQAFNEDDWMYSSNDTVFIPFRKQDVHAWPRTIPTVEEYHNDLIELRSICDNIEVKEFTHRRLELLDHKYSLHLALNHANEAGMTQNQMSTNRDIYQAIKVDTHIHMAAGMTPRQMLDFLKNKLQNCPTDIVMKKKDIILTLGSMMQSCGITHRLTVDQLSVQADYSLFERFDNFNNKYNPMENPELRTLLLKTDNYMNGRYFAELIQNVFQAYSRDRSTFAENRLSIYGINLMEWDKLSNWFDIHGMNSKHNKWIIQVPRVYKVFRANNVIGSFGQYLQNIFQPLWEVSIHPSRYPKLHNFLKYVSGFDSVDNEAIIDLPFTIVTPWEWTATDNPPYSYYLYYLYANIRTLNEFRAARGFSTFDLRPHCGESGSDDHLKSAFLCSDGIAHGINLKNDPSMQYLYYLAQIGLHVSPLSNNALFLPFASNPFPQFFRRGLHVSLSTDDPMMFHQTEEPLIEEYSIAARVWGLSPNDLCEIARNSVLQSGFDHEFKRNAIGNRWYMSSSLGNDSHRTHLSDIRVAYRFETYHTEVSFIEAISGMVIPRAMRTSQQEQEINERHYASADTDGEGHTTEEVIISTHDQVMEVALRDIELKREEIKSTKAKVDALRRQQRTLVASLTDIAVQLKAAKEAEERRRFKTKFVYKRNASSWPLPPQNSSFSSSLLTIPHMSTDGRCYVDYNVHNMIEDPSQKVVSDDPEEQARYVKLVKSNRTPPVVRPPELRKSSRLPVIKKY